MAVRIESDTLIPVDLPFKVCAGPGAGKTHWLSTHIRNVLHNSKKLGITKKIVCISYTNVGANTIMERLPDGTTSVEVCTIHSFLYKYIVKPYLHFESDYFGIDSEKIKVVPIESFLTRTFAVEVLKSIQKEWINPVIFLEGLIECRWKYSNGIFEGYKPKHPKKNKDKYGNLTRYPIPNAAYDGFVRYRWKDGFLCYDDVIYLAIELLKRQPAILKILAAKFPFFFIDEFQDSTPAIVDFVKKLASVGVVIGVVGDKAQTIYDFIGASVDIFDSFKVKQMEEYEIYGNRRCSPEIVALLNIIRPDFPQVSIGTPHGNKPFVLIGDKSAAYAKALQIVNDDVVHTLSYKNITANTMKYKSDCSCDNTHLINSDFDSNQERSTCIRNLIKATEYAINNDFREAWHHLDLIDVDRTQTIKMLRLLINHREEYFSCSLYDYYKFVRDNIFNDLPRLRAGNIKDFYLSHTYLEMVLGMSVPDSDAVHKTVHKAKGEEYDNVMLVLSEPKDLDFIIHPNLKKNSFHRVYYVAFSRARKNLFVCIPEISVSNRKKLMKFPIEVIDV